MEEKYGGFSSRMKRFCGLDLGTRTLGIAISDILGIVHPREEFRFEKNLYRVAVAHTLEILKKEEISDVVLGYPLNMDGSISPGTLRSERFRDALLKENPSLHIYLQDERLTTVNAEEEMIYFGYSRKKRKERIDCSAACLILEDFIREYERKEKNHD